MRPRQRAAEALTFGFLNAGGDVNGELDDVVVRVAKERQYGAEAVRAETAEYLGRYSLMPRPVTLEAG